MPSKPNAPELLGVVREFMERDLLPTLPADLWFHCKIAINILGIVKRELEERPTLESAELERLVDLLGERGELGNLNRKLCAWIREGKIADDSPDLIQHLHATMTEALRINNPKWIEEPE